MLNVLGTPRGRLDVVGEAPIEFWGCRRKVQFGIIGLFSLVFMPVQAVSQCPFIQFGFRSFDRIQWRHDEFA